MVVESRPILSWFESFFVVDVTSDKLKVKWYWDGDEVDYNNQRFQLIESGCKRILKVASARLVDQGKWKAACHDQSVAIQLIVKPINPIITAPVTTKWVCVDADLSLDAELSDTATGITWYLNGKNLVEDHRADMKANGNNLRLSVKPIQSADHGILKLETDQGMYSLDTLVT